MFTAPFLYVLLLSTFEIDSKFSGDRIHRAVAHSTTQTVMPGITLDRDPGEKLLQAVHIGDNLVTDVAGANRAGLQASVWVNRGSKPLPADIEQDCLPKHIVEHITDALPMLMDMMSQADRQNFLRS